MRRLPAILQQVIREARCVDIDLDRFDYSTWFHQSYSQAEIDADPRLGATIEAAVEYVVQKACEAVARELGTEGVIYPDHIDPLDPAQPWPATGGDQ
jgi:hypothetical protein